jgi:ubiquinone/menaquinone biosynthesis C-methylase UbiE
MTEWNASEYSRRSALQQAMADELLAALDVAGTERVLDVGCGDGKITARIAERVRRGSVLGVDPSREMIAYAASHFGPPDRPNLRFEVADARQLPYQGEFDLVVSFNALHWVPQQEQALRSIRAALKPDGRAVLRFVATGPRRSIEDVLEDTRAAPRWAPCFQGFSPPYVHYTPDAYRALARRCGLRVVSLRMLDKAWDFHTREEFAAFCAVTCVEWTRHLPEPDRPAFIDDMLDRYRAVAAERPGEENTFKFYQMDVTLVPIPASG